MSILWQLDTYFVATGHLFCSNWTPSGGNWTPSFKKNHYICTMISKRIKLINTI